jgi:dephospho-CoA kinase
LPRFVLGVTGAVGAGKSTLCRVLAEHGWSVLDIDDVAAAALSQVRDFLAQALPAALGEGGAVNKPLIFATMLRDKAFHAALWQALHPLVLQHTHQWIAGLTGPGAIDAALLFEAGLDALCDRTICVACSQAERRRRVAQRSTASARHFDALEAAQWPEADKLARAAAALTNEDSTQPLEPKIRAILHALGHALEAPRT